MNTPGSDPGKQRPFQWRAFVSVLTTFVFVMLCVTGVALFLTPPGRVANWTGWELAGLSKHQWTDLHNLAGLVFFIIAVVHIILNWRPLLGYFKSRMPRKLAIRREWALALLLSAGVVLGTLWGIAPISSFLAWRESIKLGWEQPGEQAPIPHAELLTLRELADQVEGLDLAQILANLEAKQIPVDSPDLTLGDLAASRGITPNALFHLATANGARPKSGSGHGGGTGIGRMTLKEFCASEGIDLDRARARLSKEGLTPDPSLTIRDLASRAGWHPSRVRDLLLE